MKIKTLVVPLAVIPVLLTAMGVYVLAGQVRTASDTYDQIVNLEIPIANSLSDIKSGAIRVVASASEYGFLLAEQAHVSGSTQEVAERNIGAEAEEEELISEGRTTLNAAYAEYLLLRAQARAVDEHQPNPLEDAELGLLIDRLLATSQAIVEAKRKGVTGRSVLELKEAFEEAERELLDTVAQTHQELTAHTQTLKAEAQGALAKLLREMLVASLALVLLLVAVAALLLLRVVRPISALYEVVHRIRRGDGAAAADLDDRSRDEVGLFNVAFREFVEEQHKNQEQLRQAKEEAEAAIEAQTAVLANLESLVDARTQELNLTKEAAEAANLAKTRFLATMSHELRTPMNGMLGTAQLLLGDKVSDEERNDLARTIFESGQSLRALLDDILDVSKIEANELTLLSTVFEPKQVLDDCAALFAQNASQKGLHIDAKWKGEPGQQYVADVLRLRQMLGNLVNNGIKFTDKGFVRLEAWVAEDRASEVVLEFSVTDSGVGLSTEAKAALFKPFTQGDSSNTRRYGGAGLGLSIVRSIAQLMGGTSGVESEEGNGSRFWFRCVAGKLTAQPQISDSPSLGATQDTGTDVQGSLALVVEDNAVNRKVAEALLKSLGLRVESVENGAEAVRIIQHGMRPDVVLMDIQMPVMDGLEATRQIRAWEAGAGHTPVPIVALTANAYEEDIQQCREAGMSDFLAKPITREALSAAVQSSVSLKRPAAPH